MTDQIPTSEVLYATADVLERDGWQQTWLGAIAGPNCTLGAMGKVVGLADVIHSPAYMALRAHIGTQAVGEWNDADGRTAAEVIDVLRAAALVESARENSAAEVSA